MKFLFPLCLVFVFACTSGENDSADQPDLNPTNSKSPKPIEKPMSDNTVTDYPFHVGTYTDGDSKGIYRYNLSSEGMLSQIGLAAESNNPSYLAKSKDGKFFLAVNEINSNAGNGTVETFRINGDHLSFISSANSGGAHPCHISIDPMGNVVVANYTGGNVGLMSMDKEGNLSDLLDVEQHSGKGSTSRQDGPHAHSAWFNPHGDEIVTVDLGTDELSFSTINTSKKLQPTKQAILKMKPGAGPRHLDFHRNGKWIYVLNELDCTVTLLEESDHGMRSIKSSISTLPKGWIGENTCADIHVSGDGQFVYASNRGHNSLAIFKIHQANGTLKLVGHESVRGESPRNFAITSDGHFVVVANQNSNNLISFYRNSVSGQLDFKSEIEAPKPVCVLF